MSPVYRVNKLTKETILQTYTCLQVCKRSGKDTAKSGVTMTIAKSASEFFDDAEFDYIVKNNVNVEILPMAAFTTL